MQAIRIFDCKILIYKYSYSFIIKAMNCNLKLIFHIKFTKKAYIKLVKYDIIKKNFKEQ